MDSEILKSISHGGGDLPISEASEGLPLRVKPEQRFSNQSEVLIENGLLLYLEAP